MGGLCATGVAKEIHSLVKRGKHSVLSLWYFFKDEFPFKKW